MKYKEAISQSIVQAMENDPKVVLLGQMVTDPKGVFGTTLEAHKRFPDRVIETPVSETMITGACVGLSMEGWKPILVHARADFSLLSFEHLINTASKMKFLHKKPLPFVMRVLVGRGWGQGPVHSQSFHNMLSQVPGLTVRIPFGNANYGDILVEGLANGPLVVVEPRRLYEESLLWPESFPNEDISIYCIGDTAIDALEARLQLFKYGVKVNVIPKDSVPIIPHSTPYVILDMAPNLNAISPPFVPQGCSQAYEKAWYPTANDIVKAVLDKLGVKIPKLKETNEQFAPVSSSF